MSTSSGSTVEETTDEVQSSKNNVALYNYQQKVYKPYISKYIARETGNSTSQGQANKAAGQVNAEVMKGVSGGAPTNAVGLSKQLAVAGSVSADATTAAEGKVKRNQDASLQNIVDIGRGQQTTVQNAQDSLASSSVSAAIKNKESDLKLTGSIQSSIGSAAGAALAAYGNGSGGSGSASYNGAGAGGDIDSGEFDVLGSRIK